MISNLFKTLLIVNMELNGIRIHILIYIINTAMSYTFY